MCMYGLGEHLGTWWRSWGTRRCAKSNTAATSWETLGAADLESRFAPSLGLLRVLRATPGILWPSSAKNSLAVVPTLSFVCPGFAACCFDMCEWEYLVWYWWAGLTTRVLMRLASRAWHHMGKAPVNIFVFNMTVFVLNMTVFFPNMIYFSSIWHD